MGTIVPAIIPVSRKDLEDKLSLLEGVCSDVQIDVVDGAYAKPASWPYIDDAREPARMLAEGLMLPGAGRFACEIDLMSGNPESVADTWIELGAVRLTLHAESLRSMARLIEDLRARYGSDKGFAPDLLSLGLAIGAGTDVSLIEPHLDRIDYVQFMGVRTIGRQGEPFDMRVLSSIQAFRRKHPRIPVQVDGGVTLANAPQLLDAGVSRLVAGSAIWKAPDPVQAYRALSALTDEHGLYT